MPLLLAALLVTAGAARCPDRCSCRWKYGKQTVECRGAGLQGVPEGLEAGTQVLDLSENPIQELGANAFRNVSLLNLQKIFLSDCGLRRIDAAAFSGLTNLVYLDLSKNALTALPKRSLAAIAALRELNLAENPIGRIEEDAFSAVPGLVKLDLTNCRLDTIAPAAFDPLRILEGLKLSGNRLSELHQRSVLALGSVHNVELHANPWECDCRLRPMREWLRRNNIPYPQSPTCHGPPRVAGLSFEQMSADEFACRPQLLPMVRQVVATADQNATLECRIGAVPAARVSWFWRGARVENDTRLDGRPLYIVEEGRFERVSRLVIPGVRAEDTAADVRCVGVNPAGDAQTNFTLTVAARMSLLPHLSAGHIAAIAAGLILLVLLVALVLLAVARARRTPADDKLRPVADPRGVVVSVETAPDDDINPVQKPPRLTELGFPPRYSASDASLAEPAVFVRAPDLVPPAESRGGPPPPLYVGGVTGNPLADDSYELRQLPSTSGSDPADRLDPAIYGYPADYGLPMPELEGSRLGSQLGDSRLDDWSDRRLSVQHGLDTGGGWDERRLSGVPTGHEPVWAERRLSAGPHELSTSYETDPPLDSSRDSTRAELSAALEGAPPPPPPPPRHWRQVGVPVLPPLPAAAALRVGDAAGTDV